MKAVVCTKYGPPEVLKYTDVDDPKPRRNEIRIRNHATTVTSSDCIVRAANKPAWHPEGFMLRIFMGFGSPRKSILGIVASGEVDAIGPDASRFKVGDPVVAYTVLTPTKSLFGTFAQYVCVPEDWIVAKKPAGLSWEDAAAVPYPSQLALHFLRKGDIENRKKVLIVGASGSIGSTAAQLAAKHFGAAVTGVCSSANVELVKSLGAENVIDYTKEDYSQSGNRYDLILDAVPQQVADRKKLKEQAERALAPDGKYVSIDTGLAKTSLQDVELTLSLMEKGMFKPVIGGTYQLEDMIEAHRKVESGHKTGSIIVQIP